MKTHFECGLSAFPDENHRGMTLRDYFAAKAMQSIFNWSIHFEGDLMFAEVAKDAYLLADAMLKARGE